MKTQMTKNSLIVPVGSKGGFVLTAYPEESDNLGEEVKAQYKTFIRGLLDLTDNILDGRPVHPEDLVIYDDDDPYLVVAADKGTATFSDTANQISTDYGFWLGDAFASGGSHGYDHKKEGITARGTWECVKRHFRESGVDVHTDTFTAVGIGDMSGDVFGNGMLYTDKILLKAAFNHKHIFLDPNPDASLSFQERKRLFQDPSVGWEGYNTSLVSKGGGVFARQAKTIPLSPQVQEMLGFKEDSLSGQDLIKSILRMKVDLLWNGGIGTYVKSSKERDSDVGDPNNDSVRVDASELGARIVGEGGNLGLTQLARIEYAAGGGRINTDAIDNSGGVDMSDHEVNIKILLQSAIRTGRLTLQSRNDLLKEMTSEVSQLVLANNYTQSLCLSLAQQSSVRDTQLYVSLQRELVSQIGLKPEVEFLPPAQSLRNRQRRGQGYTRPELAILLGYVKMGLKRRLLETQIPDEEVLSHNLYDYFPPQIRKRLSKLIAEHPLRREIVATMVTNQAVDCLGLTFINRSGEETAATLDEVLFSTLAAYEMFGFAELFKQVFALDTRLEIVDQYTAITEIRRCLRSVVQSIILGDAPRDKLSTFVENYRESVLALRDKLESYLPKDTEGKRFSWRRESFLKAGFPPDLTYRMAALDYLPSCLDVVEASQITKTPLDMAACLFYLIGDQLSLGWLRDELARIQTASRWEAVALSGLVSDLRRIQRQLTIECLDQEELSPDPLKAILESEAKLIERFEAVLAEVKKNGQVDIPVGTVLTRILLQLLRKLERHG
jgi:glutamate dehydrogenase